LNAVFEQELADIKSCLMSAEKAEQQARALRDQNVSDGLCDHEFGLAACEDCEYSEGCQAVQDVREDEVIELFAQAWQGYRQVETRLRDCLRKEESIEGMALLAQVLLDTHIHPGSGLPTDSDALWEAQYWWLHLYYRTNEQQYFKRAKLCDGIRHATVEMVQV
jgi:hypothetical protein